MSIFNKNDDGQTIGVTANEIIEKIQISCRLCLGPDQDVSIYSDYKNSIKYVQVALSLVDFDVNLKTNLIFCKEIYCFIIIFFL